MGRIKIRHYPTREFMKSVFDEYFTEHNEEVIKEVLDTFGFNTVEEMREAEYYGYFGLDCGWIYIRPMNKEHAHEWFLDNDRIDSKMFVENPLFNTQSTTIKEVMVKRAIKDLGLETNFGIGVRLD